MEGIYGGRRYLGEERKFKNVEELIEEFEQGGVEVR